jgi:hypothetical protein
LVRGVTSASSREQSRFGVCGSLSANTTLAPRRMNALAVDTKVNDGMMTSSPGPTPARIAAISNASVQEDVSSGDSPKRSAKKRWHFFVKMPLPEILPDSTASRMYSSSRPVMNGLLKGSCFIACWEAVIWGPSRAGSRRGRRN